MADVSSAIGKGLVFKEPTMKRNYSLFEKQDGKWTQISTITIPKKSAVRIFQNALLAPYLQGIDGVNVKGIRKLKVVK